MTTDQGYLKVESPSRIKNDRLVDALAGLFKVQFDLMHGDQ
jgi:hypothetical protein